MSLWGRLALAMVFLVVATTCVLALFNNGLPAVGRPVLAGAVIAVLLALVLAAATARSLSGLSTQLKTKQGLLENTVESIRDSVVVADESGVVVVANAAARRLLGVEPGFNGATGVRKFLCFFADGTTPMPIADSSLARALRGENVDDFELVVLPEHASEKLHLVANARPLRDETGNLRGAITVLRDITEQRRAHQALVDSEHMAQAIVQTALDAFIQTDENGVVLDWSPQAEAMTGWARIEAIGVKVEDLVFPEQ